MRAKDNNFSGEEIGKIKVVRLIGQGNWADVYLAEHVDTMEKLAVKTTSKKKFSKVPKLKELVQAEINILKSCKNPNVVRLVDSFLHKDHQFIVLEYCNGLQLGDVLSKEKKIDETTAISYLKQILNGFKGLHEVQAMHRDFKVENVMLHDGVCKIVDLGFGKQLMAEGEMAQTKLGSNLTMAPEVMLGLSYDFRVDIWSIGVVYYQMLYGTFPFQGRSAKALLQQTKKHQFSLQGQDISQGSKDFIRRCLMFNPEERINWTEIYHHSIMVQKNQEINFGLQSNQINMEQNASFYKILQRSLKKSIASHLQLDLKMSSILPQLKQTSQLHYPMFQSADVKRIEGMKYVPQLDFQQKTKEEETVQVFSFGESKSFECQQQKKEEIRNQKSIKEVRYLYLRRIQNIKCMPIFLKKQMDLFINKKLSAKVLPALCLMQKQSFLSFFQLKEDLCFMNNSFNIKQQQFELFFKKDDSIILEVAQHYQSANNLSQTYLAYLQQTDHQKYLEIKQKIEKQEINPQQWSEFFNKSINTIILQINSVIKPKQTEDYNRLLKLSFCISRYIKFNKSSQFDKQILLNSLRRFKNEKAVDSSFQIEKQSQSKENKQQSFKKQEVKKYHSPTYRFFSSASSCN